MTFAGIFLDLATLVQGIPCCLLGTQLLEPLLSQAICGFSAIRLREIFPTMVLESGVLHEIEAESLVSFKPTL